MAKIIQLKDETGANAYPLTGANMVDGLANVAKTGSYNDLSNKPTIPTVPAISTNVETDGTSDTKTSSPKSVKTFVEGKGYYTKPQSGIPASDMEAGVIPTVPTDIVKYSTQSLTDAQKEQARINIGAGTSSFSGSYNDLTNKPTIPTISTNVVSDKSNNSKASSPKSVYDVVYPAVVTSQPSGGMLPNVFYRLGTLSGTVAFTLATPSDANIVNHYYWSFDSGSTAPTITWPASITSWVGGFAPTINANTHYEISILDGIGAYMEA